MIMEKKGPVTELLERVDALEEIANKLKNDYLRSLADFDNFRRRMEREIEERQRAGVEKLMEELLVVLDNFERALVTTTGEGNVEGLKKGVSLIYRQLCDVLERHGLKGYSCMGQEFDPRRAEAVGFVEVDKGNDNEVVEELSRGYECGGRVIRPARVKVSKVKKGDREEDLAKGEISGEKEESKN